MRAKARVLGVMLEGVLVLVLVLIDVGDDDDDDDDDVVVVVVGSGFGVFVDGASVVAGSVVGAGAGAASAHGVCCGVAVDPVSMGVVSDGEELSYMIPLLVAVESRMFRVTIVPDVAGSCSAAGSISKTL